MAGRGRGKRQIAQEEAGRALVAIASIEDRDEQLRAAKELIGETLKGGKKLAKHVLRDFMETFQDKAMRSVSRDDMEGGKAATTDWDEFEKWAKLAIVTAEKLAPYQSPTFKAVAISAPPVDPPSHQGGTGDNIDKLPMDSNKAARLYAQMIRGNQEERDAG